MTKRSATAVAAAAAVAVIGAGTAYAAWTLSGNGDASATAGKVVPLDVSGVAPADLVPGGKSALNVTVTNKNKFAVKITKITIGAISTKAKDCPSTSVVATGAAIPANLVVLAAGNSPTTATVAYPDALQMSADAPNACQSAKYEFTVAVDAESTVAQNG
ncbi:hypothetical protein [Actinoplanes ianthinogenes]|nr:hypothetical protein [Actinoplanes ianthinogenes]